MTVRGRCGALAVAAVLALPSVASAAVPDGSTVLVDRPSGFGALPFDGVSSSVATAHSLSADGCFAVFASNNDVLFAGDEDTRTKAKAGANTIAYTGKIGKKGLKRGNHRATLVAADAAGNRSAPRAISFSIVRR